MEKRHFTIIGLCFTALAIPIFVRNVLILNILIMCYYYAYLALCWNLVGGYAGVLSLGHGIFYGIGAYTSAALFVHWGVTPWVGMICGASLAAISAFLIGHLTFGFELKGFFFVVVTLAITQICGEVAKQIQLLGATEGMTLPLKMGWGNFQFSSKQEYYFIILFLLSIGIVISFLIKRSKMGYNLLAIREDEDTAEASGVDTKRSKILILTLSAFLTALGASFYVQFVFFVDPESAFSTSLNINLILAVVIGGIGTIAGPILGAFFFILISELVRFLPMQSQIAAALTRMVFALALMIVMIYCPRGIFGLGVSTGFLKGIFKRIL
jgi:branched-chain amino acid transport system permease protein